MSGEYVVEEVLGDTGCMYRRLVFLSNQNIVQSETRLKKGTSPSYSVKTLHNTNSFCLSCETNNSSVNHFESVPGTSWY